MTSNSEGQVTLLRECAPLECPDAEMRVEQINLDSPPNQIQLTGSGRWLTYRVGSQLMSRRVHLPEGGPAAVIGGPSAADQIIGALRGGDWVIYRSWGGLGAPGPVTSAPEDMPPVQDSELWAWYAGELPLDEHGEVIDRPHFRIGGGLNLSVAAIGHRHIVARRVLGDEREELYLVRIAPARQIDISGGQRDEGKPLLLARRDGTFSRVLFADGPSPAQRGLDDEWPDLPTDVEVIATVGNPERGLDSVSTITFDVSNAEPINEFQGAVYTSHLPLDTIAGLDAIAPDRRHIAYVTRRGSLALHDFETQSECTLRSSQSGVHHGVAGFARDGTMFFESSDQDNEGHVQTYDLATRVIETLSRAGEVTRLKAVPSHPYIDSEGLPHPWAMVAIEGFFTATIDGRNLEELYEDAYFLPRDDETLWVIEGVKDTVNHLRVRRVQPLDGSEGRDMDFDTETSDPLASRHGSDPAPFSLTFSRNAKVCVSASQSGSTTTPWTNKCSTRDRPTSFVQNGVPATETEGGSGSGPSTGANSSETASEPGPLE